VRDVGRGKGVLEHRLEIAEIFRGDGMSWWRKQVFYTYFWERKPWEVTSSSFNNKYHWISSTAKY